MEFKVYCASDIPFQQWGEKLLVEVLKTNILVLFLVRRFYYKASYYCHFYTGKYFTGDWAYRDMDGDYQILGRKDDIVRIKGVWIQIPEIESSIVVC